VGKQSQTIRWILLLLLLSRWLLLLLVALQHDIDVMYACDNQVCRGCFYTAQEVLNVVEIIA
jgi:hypothetical protein